MLHALFVAIIQLCESSNHVSKAKCPFYIYEIERQFPALWI